MSFDENTQTMNVGSRDWLEASKDMRVQGYLPPTGAVHLVAGSLERSTQVTATGYGVRVLTNWDSEDAQLTEEINGVYDEELEQEDEEFLAHVKSYQGRVLDATD